MRPARVEGVLEEGGVMMAYILLPACGVGVQTACVAIRDRNHEVIVPVDFKEFLEYYSVAHTVIAAGELTVDGIFAWGYVRGKGKQVIALKGVTPCLVRRTMTLENAMREIPMQNLLWRP